MSSSSSPPKSGLGKLCSTPLLLFSNKSEKRPLWRMGGEDLERVFHFLDQNGDGKLSPSELWSCINKAGGNEEVSEEDLMAVLLSTDSDGDGCLGYNDFVRLIESSSDSEEKSKDDLREAFGMYESKDGSASITPKSLLRMLRRLGDSNITVDQCRAMIRHFDLDGNGVLSFEEFRVMMM